MAYHLAQITSGENRANPQPGDPAPTLTGDSRLAIADQCHGSNVGLAGTLRSGNGGLTGGVPFTVASVALRGRDHGGTAEVHEGVATALRSSKGGGDKAHALTPQGVRRLTPRECERLQGWPDDWTRYGINHKGKKYQLKDSPRYRMIGNGVTATVAKWIGLRLAAAILSARREAA